MAEANDGLGACVAEYKTSAAGFAKLFVIMLATLAIGGGMIWVSVAGGDSNTGGRVVLFILGLLFLLPTALGVYGLARGRDNAVRIHENGVVIRKGGTDVAVRFDDVGAYDEGAFLWIETENGESIEAGLDGLANARDLFARLREEIVVKRWLRTARQGIADGGVAELGEGDSGIALDAGGVTLSASQRRLAWDDIVACSVKSEVVPVGAKTTRTVSSVFLETKTESFSIESEPLSDRELLLALCNEMKRGAAPPLTA